MQSTTMPSRFSAHLPAWLARGLLTLLLLPGLAAASTPRVPPALPHSGVGEEMHYYGPAFEAAAPSFGPPVVCGNIERRIVLLNPSLVVGEPLHFRLLLRATDPGLDPLFSARLAFGTDIRALLIPPGGRTTYEFLGLRLGSNVPSASVEFDSFNSLRLDFRMAVDRDTLTGATFDEPGTYQMRILHNCQRQGAPVEELHLGDFEVTVREATGDDAAALDILSDHRVFELFQLRSTHHPAGRIVATEEQIGMLRRLVEETPGAALRPHAMLILADHEYKTGQTDEALALFDRVMEEYPGSVVAEDAALGRLGATMNQNREDEARRDFARIWSSPSMTQMILPGSPQWSAFVAAHMPETRRGQWMIFEKTGPEPRRGEEPDGPRVIFSEEVQAEWGLPAEMEGSQFELPLGP